MKQSIKLSDAPVARIPALPSLENVVGRIKDPAVQEWAKQLTIAINQIVRDLIIVPQPWFYFERDGTEWRLGIDTTPKFKIEKKVGDSWDPKQDWS